MAPNSITGAAVSPLSLATDNGLRAASMTGRAQLYLDLAAGPFFGFNPPNC
jgi:hypothetical protein